MRREQLQRYRRYLATYLRHATPRKLLNLVRVETRLRGNNPAMHGLAPYFLFVDISNACNLRCPLCQMGRRRTIPRSNRIDIHAYRSLVEPLKSHLFQVFLYNWGEPFLNRDIYEMLSFTSQNNIGTVVSSNLNTPIDASRLVDSGLEYLIVSGDGVTQEVYGTYRVGGDIEKVRANLAAIAEAKRRTGSRYPFIEWQCLVTRHNESHLDRIRTEARRMGADTVRFANLNFFSAEDASAAEEKWLPLNPAYRSFTSRKTAAKVKRGIRKPCFWLWRTAIVGPDGEVLPCCLYDIKGWGNALDEHVLTVWNNATYREARQRSLNDPKLRTSELICDRCTAPFIYR